MPLLFIRATNSEFHSRDDGAEYDRPETALALGVQSAVAIAADEIDKGHCSAAIEVVVERDNGSPVLRSVVSISVAPLMTSEGVVVASPSQK